MNLKMKYEKSNNHPLFITWYLTKRQSSPKSIEIDSNLHFHLQYNGIPVPLPQWFVQGHNARMKNVSMLDKLPAHIRNVAFDNCNKLLNKLNKRQFLKPKERLPNSVEMTLLWITYAA